MKYEDGNHPDISRKNMNKLADAIENYIELLTEVMVIPDELKEDYEKKINKAIERSRKLVKKLRNGDTSVFKDLDEWNYLQ